MTLSEIQNLDELITLALEEDLGDGDHSALACIPQNAVGKAKLLVKENGILAGVELAKIIFKKVDKNIEVDVKISDGSPVAVGDVAFIAVGPKQNLLSAERLVLNFMQRLSGIATLANEYSSLVEGTKAKILDTRKTTPGLRLLEKWAVKLGGAYNHRIGLFDMIMLKDNHIDFAGGIEQAILKTKDYLQQKGKDLKIEVETRNLDEVKEVLRVGEIDRIMLDNFSFNDTRKAVELIDGMFEVESSGGITKETIREYAESGVDFISVGALTHSIKSLDLSLKAI